MKKINISKIISRVSAVFVGILGFASLVFSLFYERWVDIDDNKQGLIWLFVFYFLSLIAYALFISDDTSYKWGFSDVSLCSFIVNCLFLPFGFFAIILSIWSLIGIPPMHCFRIIIFGTHVIIIAIWHFTKLKNNDKLKESDLMKIDEIASFAILPLTIVWVLYNIKYIIWGFAIIMGEFLIIQLVVKYILIKRKEKEEK